MGIYCTAINWRGRKTGLAEATKAVKGPEVGGKTAQHPPCKLKLVLQTSSVHWLHRAVDEFSPGAQPARAIEEM